MSDEQQDLDESVSTLDLPTKTVNGLMDRGITTIRELLARRPEELLEIDNIGSLLLEGIFTALARRGLYREGKHPLAWRDPLKVAKRKDRIVEKYLGIRPRKEL